MYVCFISAELGFDQKFAPYSVDALRSPGNAGSSAAGNSTSAAHIAQLTRPRRASAHHCATANGTTRKIPNVCEEIATASPHHTPAAHHPLLSSNPFCQQIIANPNPASSTA